MPGGQDDGRRGVSPVQDGRRPGRQEDGQVRQQSDEAHGQQGAALKTTPTPLYVSQLLCLHFTISRSKFHEKCIITLTLSYVCGSPWHISLVL